MIALWQGSANQWDCDEMGHMNVRVYVEKAMEGLGTFAHAIHMPHAFESEALSTLIPVDQHIRFLREVHPGRPLTMNGCVLEVGDTELVLYQELRHADGAPAAAFRTRLIHAEAKSAKPFAWSARTRKALEALIEVAPTDTLPRSIQPDGPSRSIDEISKDIALANNAPRIGMGTVPASHCDRHGRMQTEWFMGRISDSVPNLLYAWRNAVAKAAGDNRTGGAVLEYRLKYHAYPEAGDLFEAYSSFARAEEKFHSLVHWLIDPVTGKPWLTSEVVAVTFDLDTRKIIKTQPEHVEILKKAAPPGLSI